MSIKSRQLN